MRILFDNGTPNPLAGSLIGHDVAFARQIGWHELKNGDLLRQAEEAGYELLLTSDKNMRYQQNLSKRKIATHRAWQPAMAGRETPPGSDCGGSQCGGSRQLLRIRQLPVHGMPSP